MEKLSCETIRPLLSACVDGEVEENMQKEIDKHIATKKLCNNT
ncbi:MAG: zf-HC2 domain-containing protein [Planctomycetota bacterium]